MSSFRLEKPPQMPPSNGLQNATAKVREFVTYAEKAYLTLSARRVMHLRRAAASRGEEWHDTGKLVPLECGAAVKLRFFSHDETPRQELEVCPGPLTAEQHPRLAEEIFGGPPGEVVIESDGLYMYQRLAQP